MSFSFGLHPLLLAAGLLTAAGLTYWTYRGTTPRLPTWKRGLLMALRFVALAIILFLLVQPILRRIARDVREPVFAVLVDDSQSLPVTSGTPDSAEAVAGQLRTLLRQTLRSDLSADTRVYAFDAGTRRLPGRAPIDSLRFDGARTDIAQALDYLRDDLRAEHLGGVLLITDGQYNSGRNPIYVAERYPVPIFTVAVGDTTPSRDVQVRRVTTNDIAYLGTELPVQVGIRSEDMGGRTVTVSLLRDGRALDQETLTLPPGTAEVPVELVFRPETPGLQQITVAVSQLPGETTTRNNVESRAIRVLENKRRLLLVGAAPDPDVSALRQLLESDPATEVQAFVQLRRDAFFEGPLPSSFDDVDVIVLAGYPGEQASAAAAERLARAAEQTPLLFVLTRQTDVAALVRHFGDVLPVVPEQIRPGYTEATFVPTPAGERHPVLQTTAPAGASWRTLPPLYYNQSRWSPSPDARVLATLEIRGVALDDPLLVVRSRAATRSAALLGVGSWRWKNLPEDLESAAPLYPSLVSNLVQWLAAREDDRPVRVRPVQPHFAGGEEVSFSGQVYDESLRPVDDAEVAVEVTAPDGTRFPYRMQAVGNGRYMLDAGTFPEGAYAYRAAASRDGAVLGEDAGEFSVGGLTLEYKETRANAALLRQIAERSGGAFLGVSDEVALDERLTSLAGFEPLIVEETRETELWQLSTFLFLVMGLLATEWFLRKRSGLA